MLHQTYKVKIDYEKFGIEHKGKEATITTYIREIDERYQNLFHRPLILICPGGGYEHLSPREGEPIAIEMLKRGFNVAILKYSLLPNEFPCALYEIAYAIDFIRDNADKWDVNPNRIIVAGFSAGAHVAASLGTMWNANELSTFAKEELNTTPEGIRPDGMLLGYPVITSGKYAHKLSFERLLGDRYEEMKDIVSLEKRVDAHTPKTFIWHTFEDGSVPLENTLLFANALRKKNVPFEMHVFPEGGHGMGLGTEETNTKDQTKANVSVATWPGLFEKWVDENI